MSCNSTIASALPPEYSLYAAINLQDILYGINLVFYAKTICIFLARRKERQRFDPFYAIFSTAMLLLITIWVTTQATFGQKMWLENRNYPGGPLVWAGAHTSAAYMDLGTTSVIILQQMTDGLMIYRCRIVWDSLRATIVPFIMWLVNLALGILVIWAASKPGDMFFSGITAELGLAYYSNSVFLNVSLTCMICYRLIRHASMIKDYVGEEHATPYLSVVALLVESVLPYTLSGIAFLIAYGIGSEMATGFSYVYTLSMCISPQMLILRVAEGRAWQKGMTAASSVVKFSPGHCDTSVALESGGVVHLEGEKK